MKILTIFFFSFFPFIQYVHSQIDTVGKKRTFADHWQYFGIAVSEPGYTIWGTSPIIDNKGKIHLFVARWPGELKVDPGWRSHSEIAHYVGDSTKGPFRFSDISIKEPVKIPGINMELTIQQFIKSGIKMFCCISVMIIQNRLHTRPIRKLVWPSLTLFTGHGKK